MPDSPKHLALIIVNLRPGFDGAATAMLELMPYIRRLGYKASVFNFLTDEPQHRSLLAAWLTLKGSGQLDNTGDVYHYREGEVDCHLYFLPFSIKEFGEKHTAIIKTITETLQEEPIDYSLTIDIYAAFATYILGRRGCHFFHSLANINEIKKMHPSYRNIIRSKDISTISSFLRNEVRKILDMEAVIINPGINLDGYMALRHNDAEAIGFYAGGHDHYKGDELVNAIIEKMPENKFVIVGKAYKHNFIRLPENVNYCGFQSDMREFYRQLKVVLVPSLVPEGFSRIILEAAANGIPAIANNTGGIPEALQDSGILIDIGSPRHLDLHRIAECYVRELQKLFQDETAYEQLSQKARLRAQRYGKDLEDSLRVFLQGQVS